MRLLVTGLIALALPASASAATFTDPVTLADWGARRRASPPSPTASPRGRRRDGVHLLRPGWSATARSASNLARGPRCARLPASAGTSRTARTSGPAAPTPCPPVRLPQTRGDRGDAERSVPGSASRRTASKQVQVAPGFGAAQTVPSLGTSNYGLVAAGDAAGRSLLVWHARERGPLAHPVHDRGRRRPHHGLRLAHAPR